MSEKRRSAHIEDLDKLPKMLVYRYNFMMALQKLFSFKEVILYGIAGLTSVFVLGYSIHMLIGGMVSPATERWVITIACFICIVVIAFMAWDVARLRKKQSAKKD